MLGPLFFFSFSISEYDHECKENRNSFLENGNAGIEGRDNSRVRGMDEWA